MVNNISMNFPISGYTGKDSINVSTAKDIEKQDVNILPVKEKPNISNDVLMDLKDVQNFLFMITGTNLNAEAGKSTKSSYIDFVA